MVFQSVDQTFSQLFMINKSDNKFVEQQLAINRRVRERKIFTRIERIKQKRYEFVNNRRFGQNDGWSDCGFDYSEDMSEDEMDFHQLSQKDVIIVFMTADLSPHYECMNQLKNGLNNIFNIIDSIGNDFDVIDIDDDFFAVQLLNKLSLYIGSHLISHSLKVLNILYHYLIYF
jgi:hypothetical protein